MGVVISFVSLKGGVGKTTLALEVASALANDLDKKVLLVDANFSSPNIGLYLDLKDRETIHHVLSDDSGLHLAIQEAFGIDVVPASLYFDKDIDPNKLKKILDRHKHKYDFIVIDSSPHHSEMLPAMIASDKIFVVTTPDRVTLHTSIKAANIAKKNNLPIEGIIINRISNPKYEFDLNEVQQESSLPVIARLKNHKKILEANFKKVPLNVYDGLNEVSKEIKNFARILTGEKERVSFFEKLLRKSLRQEKVNRELLRQKFYEPQVR